MFVCITKIKNRLNADFSSFDGARGRGRTGTVITNRGILSPVDMSYNLRFIKLYMISILISRKFSANLVLKSRFTFLYSVHARLRFCYVPGLALPAFLHLGII